MSKNIKLFYFFNFFCDFRFYAPIAVLYFHDITGSYALAMSVFSMVFISQAILEVPSGLLSDRLGHKNMLLFGAVASTVAITMYAIGGYYWILLVGAALEGLSRAFYSGTSTALLYESLKDKGQENKFHDISRKTGSMFQLALSISAITGAMLAELSFALVFWISLLPQLLCILTLAFMETPKAHVKEERQGLINILKEALCQLKANAKLRWLGLANIVDFGFGQAAHEFTIAFYQMLIPVWLIGIIRALSNACAFISFWWAGKIIDRFSHLRALIGGGMLSTALTGTALLLQNIFSPFMMAVTSLFFGISLTAQNDLMQKEFTDRQRATMGSLVSFCGSIMYAIAAIAMGYIADIYSPRTALALSVVASIAVIAIYCKVFRVGKNFRK